MKTAVTISVLACAAFALLFFNTFASEQQTYPDSILGTWLIESEEAKVTIVKNDKKYHGTIVWMKDPYDKKGNLRLDSRNKDPKLRTRPLLNMVLLRDFEYDPSSKTWSKGKIYKPGLGQEVDCIIYYVDPQTIRVKGTLGFLSETQVWKRN